VSFEDIIDGRAQRLPRDLSTGRENKRHQKVVDTDMGENMGYARWIFPKDSGVEWSEARVAEPTGRRVQEYEERWKSTMVDGGRKVRRRPW
jgi:hypothetical protein